jgi:hypothetical protein
MPGPIHDTRQTPVFDGRARAALIVRPAANRSRQAIGRRAVEALIAAHAGREGRRCDG